MSKDYKDCNLKIEISKLHYLLYKKYIIINHNKGFPAENVYRR